MKPCASSRMTRAPFFARGVIYQHQGNCAQARLDLNQAAHLVPWIWVDEVKKGLKKIKPQK